MTNPDGPRDFSLYVWGMLYVVAVALVGVPSLLLWGLWY